MKVLMFLWMCSIITFFAGLVAIQVVPLNTKAAIVIVFCVIVSFAYLVCGAIALVALAIFGEA